MNNSNIVFIGRYEVSGQHLSVMYWEELQLYTGVLMLSKETVISQSHSDLTKLISDITDTVSAIAEANTHLSSIGN